MLEYLHIKSRCIIIMRLFFLFFIFLTSLYANIYYSKVEPLRILKIESNVNGEVLFIDENSLSKQLTAMPYIKIDDTLDVDELKALEEKLLLTKNSLDIDNQMLVNVKKMLLKKRVNYKRILDMKIKSTLEKDKELYDLISSENLYLSTQKEIHTFQIQVLDLNLQKKKLLDTIKNKNLQAEGLTLYSIDVKLGEVVNKSMPLATLADTSKAILTLYLDKEDLKIATKGIVYINNKKTDYKISRISYVADTQNISKYKAQIIIKAPKIFSQLVKIELKSEDNE